MDNKFINKTSFFEIEDDEFLYYFNSFKKGNYKSLDFLVRANIKLIYWYIDNYIVCNRDEYDDIFSVSCEALIESLYKYNIDKGIKFSTFLIACIRNKILKYFRGCKKYKNIISFDEEMYDDSDITFKDILVDSGCSFEEEIMEKDLFEYRMRIIRMEIEKLNEIDREIVLLYFGFVNNKMYGQSEISRKLGISQSCVSKRLSKIVKELKERFNLVECNNKDGYKILRKVA